MCGIAGILASDKVAINNLPDLLAGMVQTMRLRGPDDRGIFVAPNNCVGLANCRLAIRDLSSAAHMPMSNDKADVWITYNGELYNAFELRAQLELHGYRFASQSDTEVILHGYEAWGNSVVQRLRGMFAFGILDLRMPSPSLLLARDPLGIKPLYYAYHDGVYIFASECKSIRCTGLISDEINPAGLVTYLQLGSVPAPLTIFRDIKSLEAGEFMIVDEKNLHEPIRYWALPSAIDKPESYKCACEQVRGVLIDSVQRHLTSDVPLGVFLSGGLDSSSIVALMRHVNPTGIIRTCSVIFGESKYDESASARFIAHQYQTEHVEIPVTASDVELELDNVLSALDQPSTDGINTYFVSKAARESGLTVALSGLGGDELFGGYPSFERLGKVSTAARIATFIPGGIRLLCSGLRLKGKYHVNARLADWIQKNPDPPGQYLGLRGLYGMASIEDQVETEVLAEAQHQFNVIPLVQLSANSDVLSDTWNLASRFELTCYMRHQLLRDTDVMSMANSLEVRVPIVDQVVVDKILRLPTAVKRNGKPKQLLHDAISEFIPMPQNYRAKQGFVFPLDIWMRGQLRPRIVEIMHEVEDRLNGYIRPGTVVSVLQAFDEGKLHWSRPWAIAALYSIM